MSRRIVQQCGPEAEARRGEARREEAIRTSDGGFCCGVGGVMQMFWLVVRVHL
jgi:hypothetical protein